MSYTGKSSLNSRGLTAEKQLNVCSAKYTYKWYINYPQALGARTKYEIYVWDTKKQLALSGSLHVSQGLKWTLKRAVNWLQIINCMICRLINLITYCTCMHQYLLRNASIWLEAGHNRTRKEKKKSCLLLFHVWSKSSKITITKIFYCYLYLYTHTHATIIY